MSGMQRSKGKVGEREIASIIADLTGWDVRRRVRQHDGDSDLDGIPGWVAEVKRHKAAGRGLIASWWRQAAEQATRLSARPGIAPTGRLAPVLFYRLDRADWRAVWPLDVVIVGRGCAWDGDWTAETTVAGWAAIAREAWLAADPAA
jgi:hypothetical protein